MKYQTNVHYFKFFRLLVAQEAYNIYIYIYGLERTQFITSEFISKTHCLVRSFSNVIKSYS